MVSCASVFKPTSKLFSYQVLCNWIHVEIFDPHGPELCAGWRICIYLHHSTCQHSVMLALFVGEAFISPLYNFGFFIKRIRYSWVYRLISESSIQFHLSTCLLLCQYQAIINSIVLYFYSTAWSQAWWWLQKVLGHKELFQLFWNFCCFKCLYFYFPL